jgi:hypothetical protein
MESDDRASYKIFATPDELSSLLLDDLMLVLSEQFEESGAASRPRPICASCLSRVRCKEPRMNAANVTAAILTVAPRMVPKSNKTLTGAAGGRHSSDVILAAQ